MPRPEDESDTKKQTDKPKKRKIRLESDNVMTALSSNMRPPVSAAIESEDTLKMLMQAINSESATADTVEVRADLETVEEEAKKKPKKTKKAKKPKVEAKPVPLDGLSRFFNDYGESPHLQAIETSYLRYLEA